MEETCYLVELEGLTFYRHPDGQFGSCTFTDPKAIHCRTMPEAIDLLKEVAKAAPWTKDRMAIVEHMFNN